MFIISRVEVFLQTKRKIESEHFQTLLPACGIFTSGIVQREREREKTVNQIDAALAACKM